MFIKTLDAINSFLRTIQQLMGAPDQERKADCKFDNRPQTINLNAELVVPENVEKKRACREERQITVQKWIATGTWLAFLAASYYGYVAKQQRDTMTGTLGEAQKQTSLYRQELEATQAGLIQAFVQSEGTSQARIVFNNSGRGFARGTNGTFTVTRRTFDGKILGKQVVRAAFGQIAGSGADSPQRSGTKYFEIAGYDLTAIDSLRETVIVDGSYDYNNGFDSRIADRLCEQNIPIYNSGVGKYLGQSWQPCDTVPGALRTYAQQKKEYDQTHRH